MAEGSLSALQHYMDCNKKYKTAIRAAKIDHRRHTAEECIKNKSPPPFFFKYITSKKVRSELIGSIRNDQGKLITKDKDKASVLNALFSSDFTKKGKNIITKTKIEPPVS